MDAGTLPTSSPERRWNLGADSPVKDALDEVPASVLSWLERFRNAIEDELPADYGDAGGPWLTVRRADPFDVLLLDPDAVIGPDLVLARWRLLWKFWTQKRTLARQGATRAVIAQKYGDDLDAYIENLQWAHDQLASEGGVAFWRKRNDDRRRAAVWRRLEPGVEAVLADGVLDPAEAGHLIRRGEEEGLSRDEIARMIRDFLHDRHYEPETAPRGATDAARLLSVRWAHPDYWERARASSARAAQPAEETYYVRVTRTGVVIGPVRAHQVEELVAERHVGAADTICVVGAARWQPIVQTRFGAAVVAHGMAAGQVCPRCASPLVWFQKTSTIGWTLFVIGILTTWLIVGFVLIVVGAVLIWSKDSRLQARRCTRCGLVL